MTALALRADPSVTLPAKIAYARELANSGLLPAAYRRQPANVLYAVEYGDMLGLAPMAAITGIHIIEGKPSASAGLISGLVRRAGHKLHVTGNTKSATCTITRSDDPEHPFVVTWTLRKNADDNPSAEEAGLLNKQVWKNYPSSMLKSRAITQCARDACEEALYGLHYTPEELGAEVDEDGAVVGEIVAEVARPQDDATLQRLNATPGDDPWYTGPAVQPEPDTGWLEAIRAKSADFATEEDGRALWREVAAKRKDGGVTKDDARELGELITARIEDLAKDADVVDAVVVAELDPADPWAAKVEDILSADDAEAALADLEATVSAGHMDDGRAAQVRAAISVKTAGFQEAAA